MRTTRTTKATLDIPRTHDDGHDVVSGATVEKCDSCGRPMTMKRGRFGQFLACSGYPKCKTTRKLQTTEEITAREPEETCPHCHKILVLKHGRYGPFTACSNYPKCKYVKQETTGVSCPECGKGELIVKNSKRGQFYGCSDYPACKSTLKDRPIPRSCPECGARFIVEHTAKDGGRELQCREQDCKFKEVIPLIEQPH